MELRIKKSNAIPMLMFIFYIVIYLFLLVKYPMGTNETQFRYYALGIGIFISILCLIKKYGLMFFKKTKYNELLLVLLVSLVFFIYSYFLSKYNKTSLQFRTYVQIFLIMGPSVYAFGLLNLLDMKDIFNCLKLLLLFSVILYFTETGHTIMDFLNFSNYSKILSSHFFTESSLFSEIFLQLFLCFNYFYNINKDENCKINKIYVILAGLFTIMCGKRLAILMVFITPIINFYVKNTKTKKISNVKLIVFLMLFCFGTIIYTNMLQHKIFTDFDIFKFSTGRDYILSLWEKYDYMSLGYGTSMAMIGRYLELDLVQIYLELNLICLVIFVFYFLRISNKSKYGFIIMNYCLLNMLTASSLPYSLGWIIIILSIKIIEEKEKISYEKI